MHTVSWGVIVMNWLTMGSSEAEEALNKSVMTMRGETESGPPSRGHSATAEDELLTMPVRVHTASTSNLSGKMPQSSASAVTVV